MKSEDKRLIGIGIVFVVAFVFLIFLGSGINYLDMKEPIVIEYNDLATTEIQITCSDQDFEEIELFQFQYLEVIGVNFDTYEYENSRLVYYNLPEHTYSNQFNAEVYSNNNTEFIIVPNSIGFRINNYDREIIFNLDVYVDYDCININEVNYIDIEDIDLSAELCTLTVNDVRYEDFNIQNY